MFNQLTVTRLLTQAGDVVVMLERELVELYMRLFFPDTSFVGSDGEEDFYTESYVIVQMTSKPVRSNLTALISVCSGSSFVKSISHWASSRFKNRMRFWAAIFSFAKRSISCSNSRSFRLWNWNVKQRKLNERCGERQRSLNALECVWWQLPRWTSLTSFSRRVLWVIAF